MLTWEKACAFPCSHLLSYLVLFCFFGYRFTQGFRNFPDDEFLVKHLILRQANCQRTSQVNQGEFALQARETQREICLGGARIWSFCEFFVACIEQAVRTTNCLWNVKTDQLKCTRYNVNAPISASLVARKKFSHVNDRKTGENTHKTHARAWCVYWRSRLPVYHWYGLISITMRC